MKNFFLGWGLVILSALFDSYAAYIVKSRFNSLGEISFSSTSSVAQYLLNFFSNPILITAAITFVLAPILWFFALNRIALSNAYPILVGFHLIFVLIFGILFLGEDFTTNKIIGTSLLLGSIYFFYT